MSLSRPARFPLLKLPWLCIKCVLHNSDLFDIQYIDRRRGQYLDSYTSGDTLDALKMGIDFLINVFGCTVRKVFVHGDKLSELFRLGISSVKELIISDEEPVDTTDLKYLLRTIKVTDSYIFSAPIPANFYCDPQTFKCRLLVFGGESSADWVTLEFLCQLDVPQLFFLYHQFPVADIVSYLSYWFDSENTKLEYLSVSFKDPVSQDDFKIDHLNPMTFCEKRRSRFPFTEAWKNTDMSGGIDILRQDGLLATLFVKPDSILFYIWHKRFPDAVERN